MIEFLTLFLGLVVGVQNVEVGVGPGVAEVELFVDGESAGKRRAPPWVVRCDFGAELAPHELVAVARNAAGDEIARARQLVNLPRDLAEATLVLLPPVAGQPRRARVAWQATDFIAAPEIKATLDGQPVVVSADGLVELGAYDPRQIHLLRAELEFSSSLNAQAELVFGGVYAEEVTTELTAVSVLRGKGGKNLPKPEAMQDWFRYAGRPLRVVAVERGNAEVFVVRGRSETTLDALRHLATKQSAHQWSGTALRLGARLHFVLPVARASIREGMVHSIFPISGDLSALANGRIDRILTKYLFQEDVPGTQQQLADAVAIAGVRAAAGNRPRAVVLVTSPDAPGLGLNAPPAVERFLEQLQVPLFVWVLPQAAKVRPALPKGRPRKVTVPPQIWTASVGIGNPLALDRAIRRLLHSLDSQFVVWLEGSLLPHRIEITAEAGGLTFAGALE